MMAVKIQRSGEGMRVSMSVSRRVANRDGSSRVMFFDSLARGCAVWYRSNYDDLDREEIRREASGGSNQDKRLMCFQVWCEMRDGASTALKVMVRHLSGS